MPQASVRGMPVASEGERIALSFMAERTHVRGEREEGFRHIGVSSCRSLEELEPILRRKLLAVCARYLPRALDIALIAYQYFVDRLWCVSLNVPDPLANVLQRLKVVHIIDKEDSHSSPIVSLRDGPEALLQRQGRECDTSIKVSTGSRSRWRALREAAGGRGADESPTVLPSRARFQRVGRQSVLYFSPFAPHLSRGVPYLQLDCFPTNLDRLGFEVDADGWKHTL
mmetsp:Transcript_4724/g.15469  ORF Transcript_4724/g.15469 Transcript_4724/m.15469 type:complete len:227 (+) Transcript_4724:546-1226(+)